MHKWYENQEDSLAVVVASRIRILRNFKSYLFPTRLTNEQKSDLSILVEDKLNQLPVVLEKKFENYMLNEISDTNRIALRERQVINKFSSENKAGVGLILSEDESVSLTINGMDHLRMQISRCGMELDEVWQEMNQLDDFVNKQFEYAFHEKFGYMTVYPTNVGNGMRAYLILHLPMLSSSKRFRALLNEISRYGVTVKGAFGEGQDNDGNMFVLYNQKTLGLSEKDIIQVLTKVARQLASQEKAVRRQVLTTHRLELEDSIYRSYGTLKYAKNLSLKETIDHLSQIRLGQEEGLLSFKEPCNCYKMMLGVQNANLQTYWDRQIEEKALNRARATYIQRQIPELREE